MGGYKKHNPTTYVVQWPDGVVKVGYTEKQRWRKFVILGATVLATYEFDSHVPAFAAEQMGLDWLAQHGAQAFGALADSRMHVGPDGGGYKECYRIGPGTDAQALLAHMLGEIPSIARIHAEQTTQRNATNERNVRLQDSPKNPLFLIRESLWKTRNGGFADGLCDPPRRRLGPARDGS